MLHFIENIDKKNNKTIAKYKCDCGNIEFRIKDNVPYINNKFCKKCNTINRAKPIENIINNVKVVKDLGMNNQTPKKRMAVFECSCGNTFISTINAVKNGHKKSCGCVRGKQNLTHNLSNHRLYRKWSGMITRCFNEKETHWHRYGGRGITICDEWRNDFKCFYDWAIANGYQEGLTIDRINNDGNYEPNNCQWITMQENTKKDSIKFYPTLRQESDICELYLSHNITVTNIAKQYNTHKQRISNILKKYNIKVIQRRQKIC